MNGRACKQGGARQWARYSLWAVLVLLSTMQVNAQPNAQRWTLEQCLERALEVSPDVHEAMADIHIAETRVSQAKAGRLPKAKFTAIVGINKGVETGPEAAITGDTTDDLGVFSNGELEIILPLYTFGRLRNEIRAAAQGVSTMQAATEKARHAVIAAIKELYYNLLLSRQIKELLVESEENFTKALDTVQERLEAEAANVTQQDLLRLRIGQAEVSKRIASLGRAIEVTRSGLMRHLGAPIDGAFDIADTRLKLVELRLQPLAFYLERLGLNRPEIAQLEAGLEAQKARLQAARSAYYPMLFLAGGLTYKVAPHREDTDNPFLDDFNSVSGPGAALGMRWQLDFWMTRTKVAERLAEIAKIEVQKHNAETGIALDIKRRYLEVEENQQNIKAARTARKAARALLVTTLTNFNLGIGEGIEVFRTLALYMRVVSDYYETLRDFNMAAARLSQAAGQEVTTLRYQH